MNKKSNATNSTNSQNNKIKPTPKTERTSINEGYQPTGPKPEKKPKK